MDRPIDDAIAITGHWTKYGALYWIPYRSLLLRELDNLLVAGRCISVDHRTHHATKEIPACMATGEAAGTAAALAVQAGIGPKQVDVAPCRAPCAEPAQSCSWPTRRNGTTLERSTVDPRERPLHPAVSHDRP